MGPLCSFCTSPACRLDLPGRQRRQLSWGAYARTRRCTPHPLDPTTTGTGSMLLCKQAGSKISSLQARHCSFLTILLYLWLKASEGCNIVCSSSALSLFIRIKPVGAVVGVNHISCVTSHLPPASRLCRGSSWTRPDVLRSAGPKALVATCDEMRDHLFQLLRPKYFKRWKQRHQVYYKCVPSAS